MTIITYTYLHVHVLYHKQLIVLTTQIHVHVYSKVHVFKTFQNHSYKRGVLVSGIVMYINLIIESVLIRGVSLLERCPYFRVSFLEGFHCIPKSLLLTLCLCSSFLLHPHVPIDFNIVNTL